jgi:hypothetical protein
VLDVHLGAERPPNLPLEGVGGCERSTSHTVEAGAGGGLFGRGLEIRGILLAWLGLGSFGLSISNWASAISSPLVRAMDQIYVNHEAMVFEESAIPFLR